MQIAGWPSTEFQIKPAVMLPGRMVRSPARSPLRSGAGRSFRRCEAWFPHGRDRIATKDPCQRGPVMCGAPDRFPRASGLRAPQSAGWTAAALQIPKQDVGVAPPGGLADGCHPSRERARRKTFVGATGVGASAGQSRTVQSCLRWQCQPFGRELHGLDFLDAPLNSVRRRPVKSHNRRLCSGPQVTARGVRKKSPMRNLAPGARVPAGRARTPDPKPTRSPRSLNATSRRSSGETGRR
jgi:hypothetical protein